MNHIIECVQVNIPLTMLLDGYLQLFLDKRLNPEIGIDAEALDRISLQKCREIADRFLERGRRITIHGPFMDLSPGSPDASITRVTRERLQQLVDLVPLFRPHTVVCHAGYDRTRYDFCREEWLERAALTWSETAAAINSRGARLVIENVYEHHPQELYPLLQALEPAGVGLCLDVGHLNAFGRAPMEEWLDLLGPCIRQLHLHDNHGERDDHLALGAGSIDFTPLLERLVSGAISPDIITLEPHREEDLWGSLAYLKGHPRIPFTGCAAEKGPAPQGIA